jgi:uroporphyrinogen decarboxylase
MNHWDRLQSAIRAQATDCPPISLWRHWPELDQDPRALAKATVAWQRRFDFDLVRFMPANTCGIEQWGARSSYQPNPFGMRTVTRRGVVGADAWERLSRLDAQAGDMANQNTSLGMVVQALGGTVPVLQTVSSPLSTARELAGDAVFEHMRAQPESLEVGLEILARVACDFARSALRAGASGIALVTHCASADLMTGSEYLRFGRAFDLRVLESVQDLAQFNLLHACGRSPMVDLVASYPVQIIVCEDRRVSAELAAQHGFGGLVSGGIDERGSLVRGPESQIAAEIAAAIGPGAGARVMIAPGYALPLDAPEAHIEAAVRATRAGAK